MQDTVDLSIVIPVKNEEESIPVLAEEIGRALEGITRTWECVWVDDGSTDGTLAALEALHEADPYRQQFVSLDRNYGQSHALGAGFRAAAADIIATLDGDLQNDPAEIPRLLKILDRGEAEMVTGIRIRRQDNWVRRIASRIGNGFRNWVTGDRIDDVGCSLRVFRRECLEGLPVFKGMHRFFPTLVRMQGFTVQQVPVAHRPRPFGQTKYGIGNRMWSGMRDCFGVRWLKSRARTVRVQNASRRLETVRVQKGRYA